MHKLNRVFNGDNMARMIFIDVIDHRRQSGRLARTSGARYYAKTTGRIGNLPENISHTQIFHTQDLGGYGSKNGTRATGLIKNINAKTGDTGKLKREVRLQGFLEALTLMIIHNVIDQLVNLCAIKGRQVDSTYITIFAD